MVSCVFIKITIAARFRVLDLQKGLGQFALQWGRQLLCNEQIGFIQGSLNTAKTALSLNLLNHNLMLSWRPLVSFYLDRHPNILGKSLWNGSVRQAETNRKKETMLLIVKMTSVIEIGLEIDREENA